MTDYKESFFNIDIGDYDGKRMIFNTATTSVALFDKESLSRFRDVDVITDTSKMQGEIDNGYIVPIEDDEVSIYMSKSWEYAHNYRKMVQFTIVPSFACNYRCKYCFEEKLLSSAKNMSPETVDKTIRFIENHLIEHECNKLVIEWFGGEPLLQKDNIFKISTSLIEFCDKNNIEYKSHMISNARLLTPELAAKLKDECKITLVQITIDGLPKKYAELKGCREEDFYAVVSNIKGIQGKGMDIAIRFNVSKDTKDDIKELLDYLYNKEDIKTKFYLADVRDYNGNEYALDTFYDFKKDIYLWAMTQPNIFRYIDIQLPIHRSASCKATSKIMVTIDYQGNIYQCPHMIDKMEPSGNVSTGIDENSIHRKAALDNKLPDKCYKCKYLPACLGNCYADREIDHTNFNCEAYKADIVNRVKVWYAAETHKV